MTPREVDEQLAWLGYLEARLALREGSTLSGAD
jgi:hypothetical protein